MDPSILLWKHPFFVTALKSLTCFAIYLEQSCELVLSFLIVSNLMHKALLEHNYSGYIWNFIHRIILDKYLILNLLCLLCWIFSQISNRKFSFSGIILLDIQIHFCKEWTAINHLLTKHSYSFILKFTAEHLWISC